MKRINTILFILFVVYSFISCEQKELFICDHEGGENLFNVVIHWDSVPVSQRVMPKNMTVHWYPATGSLISSDMGPNGGQERLNGTTYNVMCMDFRGNANLGFRSNGTRPDFEVYNIRATGTYNINVPPLPNGETTVAEANPPYFYIDSRSQVIQANRAVAHDTLTVHFYPKNVLREFTFMIYDVTGARHVSSNSGAISGMSGSYFPALDRLAEEPSTILFQRVEAITNAQNSSRWTTAEKALFTAKNPDWADPDTIIGWTRDWITGKFVTFGPLDRNSNRFRLTVEAFNNAQNGFHGAWGYWHGQWENTVASQIDSAMGKNGTLDEQLAWRQRNGGYDIVLYNDNRLVVTDGGGEQKTTDGGFVVSVDDWGEMIDVPTTGSRSGMTGAGMQLRAQVNTYATIPDFVVNGVWQGYPGEWNALFNAQLVYKPEGESTRWDYSPKKYWYPYGHVDFYAYAPAAVANLKQGLFNNGLSLPLTAPVLIYTMPFKDGREEPPPGTGEPVAAPVVDDKQEDLLVAVQYSTSPPPMPTDSVPMTFRHAFSRVSVKAKMDGSHYADGYRIKVTRVDLRNLYTKGHLKLEKDVIIGGASSGIPMTGDSFQYDGTVTLWTNLDSLAHYRFKLMSNVVTVNDDYTPLTNSDDGLFVMPQQIVAGNLSAIYVEYNVYTYSPTEGELYVTSATKLIPIINGFTFEIGRSYMVLIELKVEN